MSAALISMMIIYPPFQIMGRGMGYSWIFLPPHEAATINVGQLLVQWMAVGLIGGIIFLIVKDNDTSATGSTDTAKASGTPIPEGIFTITLFSLRLIRGIAGFFAGWQLVGLLPLFSTLANYDPAIDTDAVATMAIMKLILAIIFFIVFFGLRFIISKLYFKRFGVQHPAMIKKWGL